MIVLPVYNSTSSKWTYNIELGDTVFQLSYSWNSRESSWYLDVDTVDGINLIRGIKLLPSFNLLRQYPWVTRALKGIFYLLDNENKPTTSGVTYDNLGKRYQLVFATFSELGVLI